MPNIVIFSIDSLSRGHFNLAMPETAEFLSSANQGFSHRAFIFNRMNGMGGMLQKQQPK